MNDIAVVLSVYKNVALEDLKIALESIYNQTKKGDIFIKIDGTVDKKVSDYLFREYKDKRVYYLDYRQKNLGIAISFNELFELILQKGYRYIVRMDADDIMMPYRIEYQYDFMQKHLDIDIVGGFIQEFGDDFEYNKIVKYPLTHNEMFDFFAKRVPLANVTTFFRNTFFQKAGLYPITSPTNEDTLMWMRGFKYGCRFANIPEVLVKVRVSKDFFDRRGGLKKAWSDFKDRVEVIRTLRYNFIYYIYAGLIFGVNIAPSKVKQFLYKRLR